MKLPTKVRQPVPAEGVDTTVCVSCFTISAVFAHQEPHDVRKYRHNPMYAVTHHIANQRLSLLPTNTAHGASLSAASLSAPRGASVRGRERKLSDNPPSAGGKNRSMGCCRSFGNVACRNMRTAGHQGERKRESGGICICSRCSRISPRKVFRVMCSSKIRQHGLEQVIQNNKSRKTTVPQLPMDNLRPWGHNSGTKGHRQNIGTKMFLINSGMALTKKPYDAHGHVCCGGLSMSSVRSRSTVMSMGLEHAVGVGLTPRLALESHMLHQPAKAPHDATLGGGSCIITTEPNIGLPPEPRFRERPVATAIRARHRYGFATPADHICLSGRSPNMIGDGGKTENPMIKTIMNTRVSPRMAPQNRGRSGALSGVSPRTPKP